MNTIYKIYHEEQLIYVGRTKQKLQDRLRGHFFHKPLHKKLEIDAVTKIEFAQCHTVADMYLYEIYYINLLHPLLNVDDQAKDELTIQLPELAFIEYDCPLMNKWKEQITKKKELREQRRKEGIKRAQLKRKAKRELNEEEYLMFIKRLEEEQIQPIL